MNSKTAITLMPPLFVVFSLMLVFYFVINTSVNSIKYNINASKEKIANGNKNVVLETYKHRATNSLGKLATGMKTFALKLGKLNEDHKQLEIDHLKLKDIHDQLELTTTGLNNSGQKRVSTIIEGSVDSRNVCGACENIRAPPGPLAGRWLQQYADFIKFMDRQNRPYLAIGGFAMFALRCGGYILQKDVYHTEPWRGLFGKGDDDFDFRMIAHNISDRDRLWHVANTTLTSWGWLCYDWRDAGGWGCYPPDPIPWHNYHYFFQVYLDDSPSGNGTHFRLTHEEGQDAEKIPKWKVFPTAKAKLYNMTVPVARDWVWSYTRIVGRGETCVDQWFPKDTWHWTQHLQSEMISCSKCLATRGYASFYTGDCKNIAEVRRRLPKVARFESDVIGDIKPVFEPPD